MLFFLRFFILPIYLVFSSMIGLVGCLLRPFHPLNGNTYARVFFPFALKILGIRLTKRGLHHFSQLPPGVIVGNHQHNIDLFVWGGLLPDRTISIGKKSIRWIPLFGQLYWLSDHLFIDRSNRNRAHSTMDLAKERMLKKKCNILVFAEGTRSKGRGLLPFKNGAFHMAIHAQVPIVPVVVSWYHKHLDFNSLGPHELIFEALPPIPTKGLTTQDLASLKDKTWTAMKEALDRNDQELKNSR